MKICMLVTNPVISDPRVRREASTLVKAGYQVTVIGVSENGTQEEELLDGYQVLCIPRPEPKVFSLRNLMLTGLKWVTPRLYKVLKERYRKVRRGREEGGAPRLRQNKTERASSCAATLRSKLAADRRDIKFIIRLNLALAREAVAQRADIYHAHDLDTLLAGYLAKRRTRKKLVYDFHELYTEQFKPGVKTALWTWYYSILERFLIKRADLRLTVCESLEAWASRRYGVKGVVTVMNVPHYQDLSSGRANSVQSGRQKVILYHGAYLGDRGLEQLIESAQYLSSGKILFRGSGYMEERLRAMAKQTMVEDRISFEAPVPVADLVRAASQADVGVIPYIGFCRNNRFCLPNKLFEYMMAGLAIVGSDLPELRRIIVGHDLGELFNPEDAKDIARAINELINDEARLEKMKRNSYQAARDLYNWESEEKKFLRAYEVAT